VAESRLDAIEAALQSGAAAIRADGGTTYHYTPDLVDVVGFYDELGAGREVVWLFRAGEEEHAEETTGDAASGFGMLATAEFFLLVACHFDPSGEEPGDQPDPSRSRVVNRLVRDAIRFLLSDVQLGGLAENVVNGSLFVNRDMFHEKWALAELRFVVRYSYQSLTP